MVKLKKIYAIGSVVFLVVLAISPLKDYSREWRSIQKKFNRFVENLPQKVKPVPIALQQIWARDLDRVDRCITCHIGIDDNKLAEAPQPFQSHPEIPHDFEKFGCTICHHGQGLATEFDDAHLPSEFWDKPVLQNRYLESSCGRCHINQNLELTPTLNRGRQLIAELNCVGCHEISGVQKSFVPSLDGIGKKVVGRGWLVRWLKSPHEIQSSTKMPDFQLSDEEVEFLTDFLMSFTSFPNNEQLDSLPEIYFQKKGDDNFIGLGKTRFREARCISCHAVEGKGGHLAPDLAKTASKAKSVWIFNYLKNPQRLQPGVEMPQYGFSGEEIAAITAYMEFEFIDWDAPEEDTTAHQPAPNFFERGLEIFNQYNCRGCHLLSSPKVIENLGPDLSVMGNKKIYQIDFGEADIPHTIPDYINAKLQSPRSFGKNTRMPIFDLSSTDREAITAVLLSFQNEPLPLKFVQAKAPSREDRSQGEVGEIINKYSCLKCHKINGSGGAIAPDLSIVGSQLQEKWMEDYFKLPYSLRPIVEERMPNLFISDEEIELLMNFFNLVLVNDSIRVNGQWLPSSASAERGRGLFWEKYGCQSCHILDGKGGYVGPPLDNVRNRLKPGWIFQWLKQPQKYKPGTIEPRAGLSDSEILDLVSYLMSLKKESKP
jgi:mono/diheme cytochrome c family protein